MPISTGRSGEAIDGGSLRAQQSRALPQQIAEEFSPAVTYLNTATVGLPPRRATEALTAATLAWRTGVLQPADYDAVVNQSRAAFADLVGVAASQVAVGSQVSVFVGLVAAAVPDGGEVLTATGEFTSMVFPFLAQAHRGVKVREVPLPELAAAVRPSTTLVAVSAVQSASGQLADLDALCNAAQATSTRIMVDATQAAGWLPSHADRFDWTVTAGYKWLLAPRGTCFFTVGTHAAELTPHTAGWYAGDLPWDSIYGGPLRLAGDARRYDVSPIWHAWVGQAPALELLSEIGAAQLHEWSLGLANAFRARVDLPPSDSAIVSLAVSDEFKGCLDERGVVASMRAGSLRLSFYLYNTVDDVDRAADCFRSTRTLS